MARAVEVLVDANEWLDEESIRTGKGQLPGGEVVMLGAMPSGMQGGNPSVMICMEMADGSRVFAQASMKVFLMTAKVFAEAFPAMVEAQMVFAAKDGRAIVQMVPEGHVGVIGVVPAATEEPEPGESN